MVSPENAAPRSLVLSSPGDLASALLASAVLAPARAALPNTKIFLLVQEKFAGIFKNHRAIDGLVLFSETDDADALAKKFSDIAADALAHLDFSKTVADAAALAKIPRCVAFANAKHASVSTEIPLPPRQLHEAFYNFKLLAPFGIDECKNPKLDIAPDPAAKASAAGKLAEYGISGTNYAVFCLDADARGNAVAPAVFSRAAKCLRELADEMPLLIIGEKTAAADARYLRFCRATHGSVVLDLRGQTSPEEAAWILAAARLCFSGENAAAYLASAENCPLALALLEDFSDNRWFPLGYLTTDIFTGARRHFLEPKFFYYRRAANAFSSGKIADALQFLLALKE